MYSMRELAAGTRGEKMTCASDMAAPLITLKSLSSLPNHAWHLRGTHCLEMAGSHGAAL